jgi:penicillin-binding protein 1A
VKKAARFVLYMLVALIVTAFVAIVLIVKLVLAPATGEWSHRVEMGPVGFEVGVPTVLRLVTATWFAPQLAGHSFDTAHGRLRFGWGQANVLEMSCEPCSMAAPQLSEAPLKVQRLALTVRRDVDALFGNVRVTPQGSTTELRGRFTGRLTQKGLQLNGESEDAPISEWYQLLVPTLPELQRARIAGTASVRGQWALPEGSYSLQPRLMLFSVDGLGAQALLESRAGSCGTPIRLATDSWLSRGAVAALDADFSQHAGFLNANLARSGGPAPAATSSTSKTEKAGAKAAYTPPAPNLQITLNERLARMLLPPMARSEEQVLRDLLYAVELDRTPGKAGLVAAYLDMAPWGDQVCGAEAAARRYFKRSARGLEPSQAMWLATMLRDPDTTLAKWRSDGQIDRARARSVVEAVREITPGQRAAMLRGVATARFAPPAPP